MGPHRGRDRAVADALVDGQGAGTDLGVGLEHALVEIAGHVTAAVRVDTHASDEALHRVDLGERLHGALAVTAGVLSESISGGELPGAERQGGGEGRLGRRGRGHAAVAGGLHVLGRGHTGESDGGNEAESDSNHLEGTDEERVHGDFSLRAIDEVGECEMQTPEDCPAEAGTRV